MSYLAISITEETDPQNIVRRLIEWAKRLERKERIMLIPTTAPWSGAMFDPSGEALGVQTTINGIAVRACHDSTHELLWRDYRRAVRGELSGIIGPHPSLIVPEAMDDSAEQHTRQQRLHDALRDAPSNIASPQLQQWVFLLESTERSARGTLMQFADAWARLIEKELAQGKTFAEVAMLMAELASLDIEVDSKIDHAVRELHGFWDHHEALREWYRTIHS